MISDKRKYKKISDNVFQAITSSNDDRDYKYSRDIREIHLDLKDIVIRTFRCVHDLPFDLRNSDEKESNIIERINPAKKDIIRISACAHGKDSIYVAIPDKDDGSIYSIISSDYGPNIEISNRREPLEGGADDGFHFISTVSGHDGDIYLDISIPEDQIISLVKDLKDDPDARVTLTMYLNSFASAGQDYYDYSAPRDYLVEDNSIGLIGNVSCTSRHGAQTIESNSPTTNQQENETETQEEKQEIRYTNLVTRMDSLQRTMVIGCIVILAFFYNIK